MRRTLPRIRSGGSVRQRALLPSAEGLEERMLLYATLGDQWVYGSRITYSFAPSGANIGGTPNALPARMSELGISEATWKDAFRTAAATWSVVANINLVEVPDDGTAFGAYGNQQNDPRFGDIRIAGMSLGPTTLGLSFSPPPSNGGTVAGDILLNTDKVWGAAGFNVQGVALHEFGHALGLDHSALTYAVMYQYYGGSKTILQTDDIAGIRAVWGPRAPDAFEGSPDNNVYARAADITGLIDPNWQIRLTADIAATSDPDFFKITIPAGLPRSMTVTMQSTALSSLSPRLNVYSSTIQGLGQAMAPGTFGATVSFTLPYAPPGSVYYIRAMAASGGAQSIGSYALLVNLGPVEMEPMAPPDTTVPWQPDEWGGINELTVNDESPGNWRSQGRGKALGRAKHGGGGEPSHDCQELIQLGTLQGIASRLTVSPTGAAGRSPLTASFRATASATPVAGMALVPVSLMATAAIDPAGDEPIETGWRIGGRLAKVGRLVDASLASWYGR